MDRAQASQFRCAVYRQRRPERTLLYRAVQGHFETYLTLAREGHFEAEAVPAYVEREFRRYLEYGMLAHGVARAFCDDRERDFLIAYSCKGRGACTACNARRMVETQSISPSRV